MTQVIFKRGGEEVASFSFSDKKTARREVRKAGLTVKNATSVNGDYVFILSSSEKAPSMNSRMIPRDLSVTGHSGASTGLRPRTPARSYYPIGIPVMGRDLKPFDRIIEFVVKKNITINHRGVHHIERVPTRPSHQKREFFGFFSEESGGIMDFPIDPEEPYLVFKPMEEENATSLT